MEVVGYAAIAIAAVGVAAGVGLLVASVPDLNRYLRLRRM